MKLYHYTSTLHVPFIRNTGDLRYGDIPLRESPNYGESGHAVWLTTKDYATNGEHGIYSPIGDKTEVRFTIDIPEDDPRLFRWSEYAKLNHVKKSWYATLDEIGGGLSNTWWLFVRPIPVDGLEVAIKKNHQYLPIGIDEITAPSNAQNAMQTHLGVLVPV